MSVWEWVWECGMEITAWMKYTTWVSELCFVFVKVTVVVLFFGFIFNCRRKLPFVSLLYMGMFCVRIALSFAPSLSLSGSLSLWRAPAFAQKRMSQTRFKLRLRFSAYAIYHYGHSSRDIRRGKSSDVSGDCNWIAVWLWMPPAPMPLLMPRQPE